MAEKVIFEDWERIAYKEAWQRQEDLLSQKVAQKLQNRNLPEADRKIMLHHLIFCEHPHVYTLGRSGKEDHLLLDKEAREEKKVAYYKINRGGDITYHGPGQIVGYPLFDLDHFFTDVHRYVRYLEEAVIRTLSEYGISDATRIVGYTGVWLPGEKMRKICAIGVHLKRWITMHGFAFNVHTDLSYFDYIVPCGIADEDKAVTSLQAELGHAVDIQDVKSKLRKHLKELFAFEWAE